MILEEAKEKQPVIVGIYLVGIGDINERPNLSLPIFQSYEFTFLKNHYLLFGCLLESIVPMYLP